jgi:hypothetical protein
MLMISSLPYWKSPEAAAKRRRIPWWYPIFLLVLGGGYGAWESIAELSPHTWRVPIYSETLSAEGSFSTPGGRERIPYGFLRTDGSNLRLSCYPELSVNDCLTGFPGLEGEVVTIRYFVVHPADPLLQWIDGSSPSILMEVDNPRGAGLSFQQSVARLQKWSVIEEHNKPYEIPTALIVPFFITAGGLFLLFAKLSALRE